MPKKKQRPRKPATRRPTAGRARDLQPVDEPPQPNDLLGGIAAVLNEPFPMLGIASSMVEALRPARPNPFAPEPTSIGPSRAELLDSFFGVDAIETSALLTVIAELDGDDVLARRVSQEVAARGHDLPRWMTELGRTTFVEPLTQMTDVLGDGDNLLLGVRLAGGTEFSIVAYIDHNLGTLVKDAFAVPDPVSTLTARMVDLSADTGTTFSDLDPADARARITEAIELWAMTVPPVETDSWPGCRPLVEWAVRLLPTGGTGYQRPEWDEQALAALTERFFGSPFATGLDDPDRRSLLESLLWFGTDYGPGDPLRWSPVNVEILLADWLPRKIIADAAFLSLAPELLRSFILFSHAERDIPTRLTADVLAAVGSYEPGYQQAIRSARPQGPDAILGAIGGYGPEADLDGALLGRMAAGLSEELLAELADEVGGIDVLDALDTAALPDEPLEIAKVPEDIRDRVAEVAALVDGGCEELMDVECRTAGRRLLVAIAAADPEIFRRRGKANTAAATICWIVGKANGLLHPGGLTGKDLQSHFGISNAAARSTTFLAAIGVDRDNPYGISMRTPDYFTAATRAELIAERDRYREMAAEDADD